MFGAFTPLSVAAAAARRHCSVIALPLRIYQTTRCMASSLSEDEKHQRFLKMEHENWEEGFAEYDMGFGPLTQQTIPTLLSSAGFPPSNHEREYPYALLDVATGPGFVLSAALDDALKSSRNFDVQLTGLDITHNFLSLAKQRINAQLSSQEKIGSNQVNVQFVVGNAEKLSTKFPKNTFDSIVCNFGILHFFSPDDFLSEAYRVLRPGGRVSFSAWAPPSRTEGFGITLQSVNEVGDPNVELPEGPDFFRFGDVDEAMTTMQTLGFENVKSVELSEMKWNNVKGGEMLYDVLANGTVRTKEILRRQTPEQTKAIQSLVSKKYNDLTGGGSRPLSMPAVLTSGQKPFD